MWHPGMMGFAMWGTGIVLVVLVAAGAAALAVVLSRRAQSSHLTSDGGAIELLRSRYAAGEIDEEEFQRRLATLGGG